jgi:hypothetical protein
MMENTEAELQQQTHRVPWWTTLIDALIVVTVTALLTYTYAYQPVGALKIAVAVLLCVIVAVYSIRAYLSKPRQQAPVRQSISKLVLLDEDGESIKEWYVQGETSLVIGKNSPQAEVDIDLSGAEYAALVSPQHAVLNCAEGKWYVEDADSRNGIGIRRANKSAVQRVDTEKPHEVGVGDMLYIANTRLILK